MIDRADDDEPSFDRVEHAVAPDPGRPESAELTSELLPVTLGFQLEKNKRLEHSLLKHGRERLEISSRATSEPELRQARGRA